MNAAFPFSDTNKRYHTFDYYLKHTFGTKCIIVPLDAGFSCPNRDHGQHGCIYCSARGSGDFCAEQPSLQVQFSRTYKLLCRKWGANLPAIPYFQAFTGTYAPVSHLREIYEQIFSFFSEEDGHAVPLAALHIATRPDCLSEETIAYLQTLQTCLPVTIELGLQSIHDETLQSIKRGHDSACFIDAFSRLRAAGLSICVHIINGLPGETASMMIETAQALGRLHPDFVKIHMLHILRGTVLADIYQSKPSSIPLLTREDYIDIVCTQLTYLPPQTVICRLTGDGKKEDLLAPDWTQNKRAVLNGIDTYLASHHLVQGMRYSSL